MTKIEIDELHHRALVRFVSEEGKRQANMESIIDQARPQVNDDARPQDMKEDWIANFLDKCRLTSDTQMQQLWSKILAGEANAPGKYSKRTVDFVGSMDKSDAETFTRLCRFAWMIEDLTPLVYDLRINRIYAEHGIVFDGLKHLDEIGLITFEPGRGFARTDLPEIVPVAYHGGCMNIRLGEQHRNEVPTGQVLFSKIGHELAPLTNAEPVPGFVEFVVRRWTGLCRLSVYSDVPRDRTPGPQS